MSREIDERIVAMYFDNKNFESGAQQTLKTLDQLKQSCNMEGVGKGFEAFGDISKKLKLDDMRKKTDSIKTAFKGLGDAAKKSLGAMLNPIRSVKGEIDELNGYVRKVFGIDLASKIVGNLENAFRSLTVAPISAGWNQYENTMDSVKTIMSSTGEDIDTVKNKLQEMTDYANLTIYSLNDMTSNLGKFTNNGVKLNDATNAMIGLANATADAGQGAAQASMAMYNVSQAIGVGKMTTIDWKSLENANIATQKLKRTFIQAAVASGDLEEKVVKVKDATTGLEKEETQYWTKAQKGAKAEQVTAENFRETLQKGWLTKEAMLKTFSIYSGQMSIDAIAAMGFNQKQAEELYKIGQAALEAAQEVRTFKKMMDALRESAQSSWATSFEYIFGDMQEGTSLWTDLNNRIDKILTKGAEARNGILMSWRGMMKDENGQVRKIKDVYEYRKQMLDRDYRSGFINAETYNQWLKELNDSLGNPEMWVDYRDMAVESFMDLFDVISTLASAVKNAWSDVFGSFTGDTLKNLTKGFRNFVSTIRDWLGSANDADSRLSKLRKGFSGLFNIVKIGVNAVKTALSAGWELIKPFLDPILNLFALFGKAMDLTGAEKLGDIVRKLSDRFKGLWNSLKTLGWSGIGSKIGTWFSGIWQNMKTGIKGWLTDNGLDGVVEWFKNIRGKIQEGITAVRDWWNDPNNKIAGFFKGMYESITGWFKSGVDDRGNETRSPIAQFFYRIRSDVESAFKTVQEWWGGSGIPDFFERIWNEVTGLFKPGVDDRGNETRSPISQFFYRIRNDVESAFKSVQEWWNGSGIPDFFQRMWTEITKLFMPSEIKKSAMIGTERREWIETEASPFVKFFTGIWEGIQSAYDGLVEWWDGSGIPDFFQRIWTEVTQWFTPKTIVGKQGNTWTEDSPFVKFFTGIWEGIQSAYEGLAEWWEGSGIPEFFQRIWAEVTQWFTPKTIVGKQGNTWTEESPIVQFFTGIWEGLESIWTDISEWWNDETGIAHTIRETFSGIWDSVSGVFKENQETGKIPIVEFFERIPGALTDAWNSVTKWFEDTGITQFFTDAWNWLMKLIGGKKDGTKGPETDLSALIRDPMNQIAAGGFSDTGSMKRTVKAATDDGTDLDKQVEEVPIVKFFNNIKTAIENAWKGIRDWEGWEAIRNFFDNTFKWLSEVFSGKKGGEAPSDSDLKDQKNLLESVGEFLKGTIEALADMVREVGSSETARAALETIQNVITVVGNIIDILSKWALRVTEAIKTGDTSNLKTGDWLVPLIGVIGYFVTNIISIKKTSGLANLANAGGIMTNIGGQMLAFAGGIAIIAMAISVLGKMDTGVLLQGGGAILVIGVALTFLIRSMTQLATVTADEPVKAWERVVGKLINALGAAGMLWLVLDKLPGIIELMSEAKKYSGLNGEDIFKVLEGILLAVGGLMLALAVVTKISPKGIPVAGAMKAVLVGILALAAVIGSVGVMGGIIVAALDKLNVVQITDADGKLRKAEELKRDLEPIVAIYNIVGEMIGSFVRGIFGIKTDAQKINEAADASEIMAQVAESFDLTRVSGVLRITQMLSSVAETAKGIDTGKIANMSTAMESVGDALNKFSWIVFGTPSDFTGIRRLIDEGDSGIQRFESTVNLVNQISGIMKQLSSISFGENGLQRFINWAYESHGANITVFLAAVNDIIDQAAGLHDGSNINFDGLNIVKKLYESIQTNFDNPSADLPEFNATPIVDAIVAALGLGQTAIAQAIHDMVQLGIDLVNTGGYTYNTDGLFDGTGDILNFFDDETLKGLFPDENMLKGVIDEERYAEIFGNVEKEADKLTGGLEGKMNKVAEETGKAWSGATLQIGGISFDEEFWTNMQQEIGQWQTEIENNSDYQIMIRPIIDMTGFEGEYAKLTDYFNEQVPMSMSTGFDFGEQRVSIDDVNIIGEIRSVKNELIIASNTLRQVLYSVDNSLGSKISSAGDRVVSAVSKIKINAAPVSLKAIDEGLYQSASNSALTGVPTYPHAIVYP